MTLARSPAAEGRTRILVVTPWVPTKERPRARTLLRILATHFDVCLVSAVWSDNDALELGCISDELADCIGVRLSRTGAMMRVGRRWFEPHSLQQLYLDAPAMRRAVARAVKQWRPDLVVLNVLRTAQFRGLLDDVPATILDLDEFRSAYYEQAANQSSGIRRAVWRLEAKRMYVAEQQALRECDHVFVSSAADIKLQYANLQVIKSAHVMPPTARNNQTEMQGIPIVFVGRLCYEANVTGISWFAKEVVPRIVARHPSAHLYVVGASPTPSVLALAGPHVTVVGPVDEVRPYYEHGTVTVAPIFAATGVQMKLIESLSVGAAVVASSLAAEQAGIADERVCLHVGRDAVAWADSVCKLIGNESLRKSLGHAAMSWADAHHGYAHVESELLGVVRRALSVPRVRVDAV